MRLGLLFSSTFLATFAAAQTETIIPSAVATQRPTSRQFSTDAVFPGASSSTGYSRSQTIVDCSDVGLSARSWKALTTRRPVGLLNANPAITTDATIVMSVSPNPASQSTKNYNGNHGATQTTVFNARVSLPAAANQATWPAPWQPAIPFSQPFVYAPIAGGSLVLDIKQKQLAPYGTWYVEATWPDMGGWAANGPYSTCTFSNNSRSTTLTFTGLDSLNPKGGGIGIGISGLLPQAIGGYVLSAYGVDRPGPFPLPYDMTPNGAPGCRWNIGLEIGIVAPLVASSYGNASVGLKIPPGFGGVTFYDQTLWLDPAANAIGLVSARSIRWSIGTARGAPSVLWSTTSAGTRRVDGACPTFALQS